MMVVAKIGSSSITDERGLVRASAIEKLCAEVAHVRGLGHQVVIVTSGAIIAGRPVLDLTEGSRRPDAVTLQAVSAVGQTRLMRVYEAALASHDLVGGQVLLSPFDFFERQQYLHARGTLERLLDLGVVPVINENDAVADDAIRFGDNDRIAALVAHLVGADLLVLLTDIAGVLTADPRVDHSASLIEEIIEIDHELETMAGGAGRFGSGGMASKLSAAKIAAWSGVRSVIAAAHRDGVLVDAVVGANVGTVVHPRPVTLPAKKLWIAFAVRSAGVVTVDAGAREALTERGTSLLPVGVVGVTGSFRAGEAVELAGPDDTVFAKGIVAAGSELIGELAGFRSSDLPPGAPGEIVHRDDLVMLP